MTFLEIFRSEVLLQAEVCGERYQRRSDDIWHEFVDVRSYLCTFDAPSVRGVRRARVRKGREIEWSYWPNWGSRDAGFRKRSAWYPGHLPCSISLLCSIFYHKRAGYEVLDSLLTCFLFNLMWDPVRNFDRSRAINFQYVLCVFLRSCRGTFMVLLRVLSTSLMNPNRHENPVGFVNDTPWDKWNINPKRAFWVCYSDDIEVEQGWGMCWRRGST